ncbi:20157_t:CDS:2, partial [Entrophospora sp. SA101]
GIGGNKGKGGCDDDGKEGGTTIKIKDDAKNYIKPDPESIFDEMIDFDKAYEADHLIATNNIKVRNAEIFLKGFSASAGGML